MKKFFTFVLLLSAFSNTITMDTSLSESTVVIDTDTPKDSSNHFFSLLDQSLKKNYDGKKEELIQTGLLTGTTFLALRGILPNSLNMPVRVSCVTIPTLAVLAWSASETSWGREIRYQTLMGKEAHKHLIEKCLNQDEITTKQKNESLSYVNKAISILGSFHHTTVDVLNPIKTAIEKKPIMENK